MQAVILAGGRGSRLQPLSMGIPKPMLPIFSKPVMEHTIELLAKQGVKDIIIATSTQASEIVEHFGDGSEWSVNIRYSIEDEPKGTAGAVKLVQPHINDTFLVVSGDVVSDFDIEEAVAFHRRKSALATLLLHDVDDPVDYGIAECDEDGRITRFLEKPDSRDVFSNTISTGIYVLEPEVLSSIPYFTACDIGRDLIPRLLRNIEPVFGIKMHGYWCDIGNLISYRNAHFDALLGRAQINIGAEEVEPGVWIGEDAEIHETAELTGPLYLGMDAELRKNASLKPFSVIGTGSLIDEAALVSRSIVGSRAFIGRGTRVTDCVIAEGYRVQEASNIRNQIVIEDDTQGIYPDISSLHANPASI
jgi:mannose-1-phosphate guanylyltransferase/phosphomannomutase